MKFVLSCLNIFTFASLAYGSPEIPHFCEMTMTSSLRLFAERLPFVDRNVDLESTQLGLPKANIFAPTVNLHPEPAAVVQDFRSLGSLVARLIGDGPRPEATSNQLKRLGWSGVLPRWKDALFVQSDMGLSAWDPNDLAEWLSLGSIQDNPQKAMREVELISTHAGYCTPGLLPLLCEQMRKSRALHRKAFLSSGLEAHQFKRIGIERLNDIVIEEHIRNDVIKFPFATDVETLPDGIAEVFPRHIMRLLARETLIRHLVYVSLEGELKRAGDLPLESRLFIASVPLARHLMPLLERHSLPVSLLPETAFGNFLVQWYQKIWHLARGLRVVLDVSFSPFEAASTGPILYHAEADAKEIKRRSEEELARWMRQFQELMKLNSKVVVSTETLDSRSLTIRLTGLDRLEEILFLYFISEQIAAR